MSQMNHSNSTISSVPSGLNGQVDLGGGPAALTSTTLSADAPLVPDGVDNSVTPMPVDAPIAPMATDAPIPPIDAPLPPMASDTPLAPTAIDSPNHLVPEVDEAIVPPIPPAAPMAPVPIVVPVANEVVDATQPSEADVGVLHMPPHLADQDPIFSAHEMRLLHKNDCVGIINRLRNAPQAKSRLRIPLCRLITCPLVRPIIEQDVRKLENDFARGYREGDRVIYVSLYDKAQKTTPVTGSEEVWQNPLWLFENERFEAQLQSDPDLLQFSMKFFHVYEGNHRVTAWTRHIKNLHADDPDWYISPDCIVLDGRSQHGLLLNAMNDINW